MEAQNTRNVLYLLCYGPVWRKTYRIMYVLGWLLQRSIEGYFAVHFPEEINTKNYTRMSVETVLHESTYFILFLTRHNENDDFTHRPRVSLGRFSFCWWRHNRLLITLQWPDNCDAITCMIISNWLDIDFFTAIFTVDRVRRMFMSTRTKGNPSS